MQAGLLLLVILAAGAFLPRTKQAVEVRDAFRRKDMPAVTAYRLYRLCGHRLPAPLPAEPLTGGRAELEAAFPASQGWSLARGKGGAWELTQSLEGFCPEDAARRHLEIREDRVAVYIGPAGKGGPLSRMTAIRLKDLTPEWQEAIRKGRMEFKDEQELMAALDSLDEYSKPN